MYMCVCMCGHFCSTQDLQDVRKTVKYRHLFEPAIRPERDRGKRVQAEQSGISFSATIFASFICPLVNNYDHDDHDVGCSLGEGSHRIL